MNPSTNQADGTGRPRLDLPRPIVPQAPVGVLIPADALTGVSVLLPEAVEVYPEDVVQVAFGRLGLTIRYPDRSVFLPPSHLGEFIGKTIPISYLIFRDQVEFPSEVLHLEFRHFSAEDPLLPAPLVEEALDGIIDLRAFEGDASVRVPVWPFMRVGQRIWLRVFGTGQDGHTRIETLLAGEALKDGPGWDNVQAQLSRSFLEGLGADYDVFVEALVTFDGSEEPVDPSLFPRPFYRLKHDEASPDLAEPWVEEAVGDYIDPAAVSAGATARVNENRLIVPGTAVTLIMRGISLGGVPVAHEVTQEVDADASFPLSFHVPGEKIYALGGSKADCGYWVVTSEGGATWRRRSRASHQSPVRTYNISQVVPSLPKPTVPKAEGDRLDPGEIGENEGVEVDVVYPGIDEGQFVTLTWKGTRMTDPYSDSLTVFADSASFFVPKDPYLTGNVGAEVGLNYLVRYLDGRTERSHTLVLRVEEAESPRVFIDFEDVGKQEISPGKRLLLADGEVVLTSDRGLAVIAEESVDYGEYCEGMVVIISPLTTIAFELAEQATSVTFGVGDTVPIIVQLYNAKGNLLYEETDGQVGGHYFTHQSAEPISRIRITAPGFAHIDHLGLR
jgi:hypothetical protein